MINNVLVVGSGPAGVACASALVQRGLTVTMFDVGNSPPVHISELFEKANSSEGQNLHAHVLDLERQALRTGASPFVKRHFGSGFVYDQNPNFHLFKNSGGKTFVHPTYVKGGFSVIWGGSSLPLPEEERDKWPFALEDLSEHYFTTASWMSLAAGHRGIPPGFVSTAVRSQNIVPNRQAQLHLQQMEAHSDTLATRRIFFSQSVLGLAGPGTNPHSCKMCNLCQIGCPHGAIFRSDNVLDALKRETKFRYISGITVRTFNETDRNVKVCVQDGTGGQTDYVFDKIFIGAGVLPTTAIVVDSLKIRNPIEILDTQYFVLPCWSRYSLGRDGLANSHALAQFFLEIRDPQISPRIVHLQAYSHNPRVEEAILAKLDAFGALWPKSIGGALLQRTVWIQGFFHSDESPKIILKRSESGKMPGIFELESKVENSLKEKISAVASKIKQSRSELGIIPLTPGLVVRPPGSSFHCGGSFPMGGNKQLFSDRLGRPMNLNRVHLVDSSCLPAIPATSVTWTVMANAHRIGSHA